MHFINIASLTVGRLLFKIFFTIDPVAFKIKEGLDNRTQLMQSLLTPFLPIFLSLSLKS